MTSHTASVLPWRQACRPAGESRKSMNPNSDRRKPSSTRRALASLGVHPCRFAMRLRRFQLSTGRRILITIEPVVLLATGRRMLMTIERVDLIDNLQGVTLVSTVAYWAQCPQGGDFQGMEESQTLREQASTSSR